jgi:hypothetical protein
VLELHATATAQFGTRSYSFTHSQVKCEQASSCLTYTQPYVGHYEATQLLPHTAQRHGSGMHWTPHPPYHSL